MHMLILVSRYIDSCKDWNAVPNKAILSAFCKVCFVVLMYVKVSCIVKEHVTLSNVDDGNEVGY